MHEIRGFEQGNGEVQCRLVGNFENRRQSCALDTWQGCTPWNCMQTAPPTAATQTANGFGAVTQTKCAARLQSSIPHSLCSTNAPASVKGTSCAALLCLNGLGIALGQTHFLYISVGAQGTPKKHFLNCCPSVLVRVGDSKPRWYFSWKWTSRRVCKLLALSKHYRGSKQELLVHRNPYRPPTATSETHKSVEEASPNRLFVGILANFEKPRSTSAFPTSQANSTPPTGQALWYRAFVTSSSCRGVLLRGVYTRVRAPSCTRGWLKARNVKNHRLLHGMPSTTNPTEARHTQRNGGIE